ncbi:methyl-accepting chemotaxis protein [Acuticoccus kandeliae]|uniref:methyl-accepting chemotaxis protein n=1 Tax=Acuticoccus kandeliae TaxID=2073160 RepID=UPI001474B490|nr:methyl-accepting chemotaxis protein [Acuticoccus kandeliae]
MKMRVILTILAVLTVGLGVFSIERMSTINDQSSLISDIFAPRIESISMVETAVANFRIAQATHVLSEEKPRMQRAESEMKSLAADIDGALSRIADDDLLPQERTMLDRVQEGWATYFKESTEMVDLSRINENDAAFRILLASDPTYENLSRTLVDLRNETMLRSTEANETGDATYALSRIIVIAALGFVVAIFVSVALYFDRAVGASITGITKTMTALAENDLSVEVAGRTRGDEIGAMARAVQVFKENSAQRIKLEAEQKASEARRQKRLATVENLLTGFEGSVSTALQAVASSATQLNTTAGDMLNVSQATSRQAEVSATAAEQTSANVQTVASATEEMNSSLQEISHQVTRAASIVTEAVDEAVRTNGTIKGLATASERIGEVVSLIADIAAQTNLLALNATIEAARAGDAGKGFAVVAAEVKSLAERTGKATEEISSQIETMQGATGNAVTAIEKIGATIDSINEITTAISAAVEEQSAATSEISRNVTQAATGTEAVCTNVIRVSEAAQHTGAAATQLLGAAGTLNQSSEKLNDEVERFLTDIRAA